MNGQSNMQRLLHTNECEDSCEGEQHQEVKGEVGIALDVGDDLANHHSWKTYVGDKRLVNFLW